MVLNVRSAMGESFKKVGSYISRSPKAFLFLYFLALSGIKMQAYLLTGRIFAEEGTFFYPAISAVGFLHGLFYLFNGHLELATNLIVAISTLVDFKYAPLVLTYGSFFLQLIPVGLIVVNFKELGLSLWGLAGFLTVYTGLPQAPEVWANSINLHFHFALLAAVLLGLTEVADYHKWIVRVTLAFCGLSGIPANFLAPVFFYRALAQKDKEKWIHFGIISTTALVQMSLLFYNRSNLTGRDFDRNILHFVLPIISQQLIGPFLGLGIGGKIIDVLKETLRLNVISILVFIFSSSLMVMWIKAAVKAANSSVRLFIVCAFFLSIFSILGSLGGKEHLISAVAGGRYFFASNALVYLSVMIMATVNKSRIYKFALTILMITCVSLVGRYMPGPNWSREYERATQQNSPVFNIWPDGWTMKNPLLDGQ